jgi:hypothetical protein
MVAKPGKENLGISKNYKTQLFPQIVKKAIEIIKRGIQIISVGMAI